MITLSLAEVASAVDGRLVAADLTAQVTGSVEFDSRKVTPGGLFVAFDGEKVDGHDFAAAAVASGAVVVMGTREVPGVPMIVVADPLAAMGRLARVVVDRLPGLTVIGLTGSSGKTTTKDLIAQLTARLGETVAPPGSFNNELGHPYTALQAGPTTRYLVMEKGARGIGHVRYLCEVAPPRISVVLNVGVSHIGEFGSQENIALAKGELVEALPADGLAVLNADDPLVDAMAARTVARVIRYGESANADVRAVDVRLDERGRPAYTLVTPEGSAPVRLGLTGRHQVWNSLAAAAVARELGMPLAELATALGALGLVSTRRMDVFERTDGITVIDDSYNANPASMAVALRALGGIGAGRRTVAVLGYMAELGEFEAQGHAEVGRLAAELGVDRLLVVGEAAAPIHHGATSVGDWGGESVLLTDQAAAVEVLRSELRPGDVVLVKGSRYRTWEVADALRVEAAGGGTGTSASAGGGAA
ncbi:UDP-N-acetylmuramoyl-tripeptide--D-alanyl-D-alanine ligase [Verrucosispora sp. WMMD573]|uniref:UDP-N-acetylmuramoyl-tripeptide--D-alanyl-D- alanine ligase n=1 Tax=Verrucosispora sp. WMMD573 TaxID=3015149 RepID=UPI00248AAE8F|nr:UDP-N-acetylmuramoyl-tripeptide--D-alanyl-D-alanine ligase [Verrucosispora sp. WMMD573]WBB54201.1 UDP-N-acetylmuramoyl-tripeptide--D-alanyl-D-alanine ligase [Verrucosispora sp. WMMD573]